MATGFLLLNQQHLQGKAGLAKELRKADQFLKEMFQRTPFGRFPAARLAVGILGRLYDPFFVGYRIDQPHRMVVRQPGQFALYGGKISRLNLYQKIIPHNVDDETVDWYLKLVIGSRIPPLQGGVKGFFV